VFDDIQRLVLLAAPSGPRRVRRSLRHRCRVGVGRSETSMLRPTSGPLASAESGAGGGATRRWSEWPHVSGAFAMCLRLASSLLKIRCDGGDQVKVTRPFDQVAESARV
jgi:hypothetical protein